MNVRNVFVLRCNIYVQQQHYSVYMGQDKGAYSVIFTPFFLSRKSWRHILIRGANERTLLMLCTAAFTHSSKEDFLLP